MDLPGDGIFSAPGVQAQTSTYFTQHGPDGLVESDLRTQLWIDIDNTYYSSYVDFDKLVWVA